MKGYAKTATLSYLCQKFDLYKGLVMSPQKAGCTHMLDMYCQGLTSQKEFFQTDPEFVDIQFEAAWRAGNWDFSFSCQMQMPYMFHKVLAIAFSMKTCTIA